MEKNTFPANHRFRGGRPFHWSFCKKHTLSILSVFSDCKAGRCYLCECADVAGEWSYLSFSDGLHVYDGDNARHVGASPRGTVGRALLVRGTRGQRARQLGHHFANHGQTRLQSLEEKEGVTLEYK